MVKINRIYTKTGDDGTTGLVGGARISKDAPRVAAYGDLDELNAYIGLCRTRAESVQRTVLLEKLIAVENELFDMGAELASPPSEDITGMPRIGTEHCIRLEEWIDALTGGIPELRSFVLPGGTELNAALHIARTVARRCERTVLALHRAEPVSSPIRIYLNRLSDLLFAMARFESHAAGVPEYLWKPGATAKDG